MQINHFFLKLFYNRNGKLAVTGVNTRNERWDSDGPDSVTFMLWIVVWRRMADLELWGEAFLIIQSLMRYCCESMQTKNAETNVDNGGQASELSEGS